jgi:hypothetical protein
MMGFFNFSRDEKIRDVHRRKLQGVVTENKDPLQLQRIKVRIHDLHDEIADEDLPWHVPSQMSPYSGAANIGDHGPIPPKGTKIWVNFDDASQYHGAYGGAAINTQNKLPEFTQKQSTGGTTQDFNQAGSADPANTTSFDFESAGAAGQAGSGTDTILPDASKYPFYQNYPDSHGHINETGSIHAKDQKTDLQTDMHVTSTGHAIDGKGNVVESVNGDTDRPDNPDAKKLFGTGKTTIIKGNWTIYVTGNVDINSSGNTTIKTTGETSIESQNTFHIKVDPNGLNISSKDTINMKSKNKIQFDAPIIQTSVPIKVAGTAPYEQANKADTHASPKPRTRPNPTFPANDTTY